MTLQELKPGRRGTVLRLLDLEHRGRLGQRLMVLGVLPGVRVEVVRTSPAVVFRIGHSQFAVDEQLAEMVLVRPEGEDEQGNA
jgi:DtxR family Mn-dependent transcriptional regulator